MAPKRVLLTPLPLPSATMTFGHHNNTNNTMNTSGTSGIGGGSFGVYKLISVGTSDRTIRVPSVLPMSERPYRKAMVANLFFRKIEALASDPSFTSADLISTIATYFDFNTSPAENEATAAADKIRAAVFHVDNLTGLGFRNQFGADVAFDMASSRPANLRYFAFRSMLRASDVDSRGPATLFTVDFVLRLPQTTVATAATNLSNLSPLLSVRMTQPSTRNRTYASSSEIWAKRASMS